MLLHQENCTLLVQERMDNWETTDCRVSIVLFLFIAAGMLTLRMEVNQHNSLWYTELLQGETSVIYLHQEMLVIYYYWFVKIELKKIYKAEPKKYFLLWITQKTVKTRNISLQKKKRFKRLMVCLKWKVNLAYPGSLWSVHSSNHKQ